MSASTARRAVRTLLVGAAFALPAPAFALEANEVADQLAALLATGTMTAVYDSATEANGVITITGFTLTDPPNFITGSVETITVTNAVENEGDDAGFTAESIILENGTFSDNVNVLSFERAEAGNLVIPPTDILGEENTGLPLSILTATGITLTQAQTNPAVIEGFELTLSRVEEGVPYGISVTLSAVSVPTALADNSEPVAILQSMGFEELVLDLELAGGFDSMNDILEIDSVAITIRDFGRLEVSGRIEGAPLSTLAEPGGAEELLGSASIVEARIRFDNAGAVEAFLTEQGRQMQMNAEDVAFGLSTALRIFLRTLNSPELEAEVGDAVVQFLIDPQSITITAHPEEPMPLAVMLGLMLSAPTQLPTVLGVGVTANAPAPVDAAPAINPAPAQ